MVEGGRREEGRREEGRRREGEEERGKRDGERGAESQTGRVGWR